MPAYADAALPLDRNANTECKVFVDDGVRADFREHAAGRKAGAAVKGGEKHVEHLGGQREHASARHARGDSAAVHARQRLVCRRQAAVLRTMAVQCTAPMPRTIDTCAAHQCKIAKHTKRDAIFFAIMMVILLSSPLVFFCKKNNNNNLRRDACRNHVVYLPPEVIVYIECNI